MPRYTATTAYSAAIAVAVGDIVQNTGRYGVLVCAQDIPTDEDAVEILPGKAVRISTAGNIRVRSLGSRASHIKVVKGL